ncbi:MAG TPA: DUF5916 domain-containing protein [Candidatus Aminicenantes bacterium]|nr:DUF5916 domain-containing protein [Candidatus Aminicenantes bacterium]HRY66154.1 DUF5916 domain-containing protein [Candidatus Aminicenantes bacterium]HRZ73068.1 DUF5916 domain-containing protein [Candidatus Aminicenantes bacterium]
MTRGIVAVLGAMLAAFAAGAAPSAGPDRPAGDFKTPLEIPRLTRAPKIDGVLDNPVWETEALKIDAFVQLAPKENGAPTEKTAAYLGHDEKNLYVAFRAFDRSGKVRCSITKRDGCLEDDWVFIFIDTFNEKRRAFSFLINPAGVQMDMMRIEEGGNDNMDDSWDTVFVSDGSIDAEGYTVEMAIPFKSLRFPDEDLKTWNIVLGRNLPRTGEVILHPTFSRDIPGLLSNGRPFLIRGAVERGRNVEVMPFVTSLARGGETAEGRKLAFEPGANFKLGLSSNTTVDLTANPDFSQIEADEPQIDYNLRYALRYAEKRPFFLEGMEIFNSPDIETVYTRQFNDPSFGAKLSGKSGRFTYGLLSAYDLHPTESLWEIPNGGGETSGVKAFSNVLRTKADVGSGSYIGFTLTDKELGGGSWSRLGGVDGQLRFKNRVFFNFQVLASSSSAGGERTPLAPGLFGELFYDTKHWTLGGSYKAVHPDFQASLGFVNRTDYESAGVFASYTLYPDKKYLNQVRFRLQAGVRDGYADGTAQDTWIRPSIQFRLSEFNQVYLEYEAAMERFAGVEFRKQNFSFESEFFFISWMPLALFFQTGDSINYDAADAYLGYSNTYGASVTFKPSKRLQLGTSFSKQTFWDRAGGAGDWDYNVVREKVTYQVSKTLSFRAIADYNFFYKQAFGSLLASWVLRPGTVFFLGFDNNYLRDSTGRFARQNYNVFVKFSYWWRL